MLYVKVTCWLVWTSTDALKPFVFVLILVPTACLTTYIHSFCYLLLLLMSVLPVGLFPEPSATASSALLLTRLPSLLKIWWKRWKQLRPQTLTQGRLLKRTTKTTNLMRQPANLSARKGQGSRLTVHLLRKQPRSLIWAGYLPIRTYTTVQKRRITTL